MTSPVHYIPILTTLLSAFFFIILLRHWMKKPTGYFLWWTLGVFFYGAGTVTESLTTLFGWSEPVFKAWYILGALLGGAPLAQGTIYLLMKKRTADILSICLVLAVVTGSVVCILSPIDYSKVETYRLSGKVLEWNAVRFFPPFINTYSLIFFVGGAAYSAWGYWKKKVSMNRCYGNILIAVGGLLPGIGGTFTRYGYVEVLYITEFVGLILIYLGYNLIKNERVQSIHSNQTVTA